MRDVIFALATAPGRAAVAIVRVSGVGSGAILERLCGAKPKPRLAVVRKLRGLDGDLIDEGLVLWFPAPGSFTGEDVFELQLHGGPAIIEAMVRTLTSLGGRPADPGEFTRRAFEAGRLELSQAEAIADLVDAETESQRRQALLQLGGALTRRGEAWREALLSALAFLGAQIDFPDEDVPPDVADLALAPLRTLKGEIELALEDVRGERIRDGLKIALIGAPNAGKSSLLNALIGRDAAIVTVLPGTTRDVIEAPLVVAGYKVLLADTAGIREAVDDVEIEGVRRARTWARGADLRLWVVDPEGYASRDEASPLVRPGDVLVASKTDVGIELDPAFSETAAERGLAVITASVVSEGGLDALRAFIEQRVVERLSGAAFPAVTRIRHRTLLEAARDHLDRGLARPIKESELIAEDARLAARSLEQLAGRLDPEAVLDRVFATFCIGK